VAKKPKQVLSENYIAPVFNHKKPGIKISVSKQHSQPPSKNRQREN